MQATKPTDRNIHLFTDSLSCLQQLACLPYKYKYTNAVVVDVAEKLAQLAVENEIELHFIPSHTNEIPESDEIDELAKQAACDGHRIDHDPFVSSYRLFFTKIETKKLQKYLRTNLKPSGFHQYPDRRPLMTGRLRIKSSAGEISIKINSDHALLNRVRSGHTCSRVHLKNVKIDTDDTCRQCGTSPETVKHQLLECGNMEKHLTNYRVKYETLRITNFNKALHEIDDTTNQSYYCSAASRPADIKTFRLPDHKESR